MSGHNKWSQIKRQKGVNDAAKGRVFSKHAAIIAMESRLAHGSLAAPSLAAAIERAKKDSMPKENIDRAVAKGSGVGATALESVMYEMFGPGGVAMIVTAITDNNNRTAPEIRHILSKQGYVLGAPGSAAWAFTKSVDGYTPQNPTELSDVDGEKLATLIEALEEQDDVQEIYTTADGE